VESKIFEANLNSPSDMEAPRFEHKILNGDTAYFRITSHTQWSETTPLLADFAKSVSLPEVSKLVLAFSHPTEWEEGQLPFWRKLCQMAHEYQVELLGVATPSSLSMENGIRRSLGAEMKAPRKTHYFVSRFELEVLDWVAKN